MERNLRKYIKNTEKNVTDREKFEEYMSYGVNEKISVKKCLENELLLLLFSLPSIILGVKNNIFWIIGILPVLVYLVFVVKFQKGRALELSLIHI